MLRYVRVKAKAKYQFTTRLFQTRYYITTYLYPRTYAARNKMNRHVISPSMKWPRDWHQILQQAANGNEIDFSIKMQNLNSP